MPDTALEQIFGRGPLVSERYRRILEQGPPAPPRRTARRGIFAGLVGGISGALQGTPSEMSDRATENALMRIGYGDYPERVEEYERGLKAAQAEEDRALRFLREQREAEEAKLRAGEYGARTEAYRESARGSREQRERAAAEARLSELEKRGGIEPLPPLYTPSGRTPEMRAAGVAGVPGGEVELPPVYGEQPQPIPGSGKPEGWVERTVEGPEGATRRIVPPADVFEKQKREAVIEAGMRAVPKHIQDFYQKLSGQVMPERMTDKELTALETDYRTHVTTGAAMDRAKLQAESRERVARAGRDLRERLGRQLAGLSTEESIRRWKDNALLNIEKTYLDVFGQGGLRYTTDPDTRDFYTQSLESQKSWIVQAADQARDNIQQRRARPSSPPGAPQGATAPATAAQRAEEFLKSKTRR